MRRGLTRASRAQSRQPSTDFDGPGPTDTDFLFEDFLGRVAGARSAVTIAYSPPMPAVQKVLLLGSGGLSIGQVS